MLRGRWGERSVDWAVVLTELYADESTWCRWRAVTELRAYEALALHHHLDPDALNLGRADPKTRRRLLDRLGRFGSGGPLERFCVQLAWLATDLECGRLPCVEVSDKDILESVVSVKQFARYAVGIPMLPRPAAKELDPGGQLLRWPAECITPSLRDMNAASLLYRTVAEGGSYVPGDRSTAPDVAGHLTSTGRVSKKLAASMAAILRPVDLPKGRPPRPRPK